MKIISWNIACLPDIFNLFGTPKYRLKCILNELEKLDPDVICLQEVFSENSRKIITCFDKYKEINIEEVKRNGLVLSAIKKIN